ncbi:threonine/homoserine/homoserine lactone efflux protein [Planktotalea frisia]|jgi:threonine/homoserine/homoserine lactone efflux protein|uniref:Homoserine/homoserine lactone efflux protein n=1 Tax=Planktotalea frisia TaxID=696762 RepID=A0A1L9NW77_9RHOB|nr:LysE family translocator [Planktotalea frisia]OJI93537.1 homoserine/homoserine lactone efflux protein [Planktotalea frisia]PZX27755.1 threonine/homoserine/homoserine lactone efflux protein [Planktotalea frisia]
MAFETYLIYLAAVAVFFATPPDTSQLLIISNSVRYGLRKSAYTIAGDLSANCLQMTGAAFGLAAIIATSATAFSVIKWLGVAYLIYIGIQLFRSRDDVNDVDANQSGQAFRLYRQGFVTSMANPFAVVFFGALFPQFIDPALAILPQLLILGVTYLIVDGAILLLWGWLGVRAASALKRHSFGLINKICGALMIAAAALLGSKDFQTR